MTEEVEASDYTQYQTYIESFGQIMQDAVQLLESGLDDFEKVYSDEFETTLDRICTELCTLALYSEYADADARRNCISIKSAFPSQNLFVLADLVYLLMQPLPQQIAHSRRYPFDTVAQDSVYKQIVDILTASALMLDVEKYINVSRMCFFHIHSQTRN